MPKKPEPPPRPPNLQAWNLVVGAQKRETQAERWRKDPVAWVNERLGESVWSKQREILQSVAENKLTVVKSSHGIGKSYVVSRIVGYFIDNYPPGDFFVVTTAPTWAQVRAIIWRYVAQMSNKHDLPGYVTQNAEWKIGNELVAFGRKPADQDQQGFQGLHAARGVVAILDEASGVPDQIWNAVDSLCTTPESRIVAVGNPDAVSSRFYRACTTEPGWNRIKVSSFDTPAFTGEDVPAEMLRGLVSREWVEDKQVRWGESSALYKIKVLGEFAEVDDFAVIPLAWIRMANQRWLDYHDLPLADQQVYGPKGRTVLGVDVGHQGEDKTVIVTRVGHVVQRPEFWSKQDNVKVAGLVKDRLSGGQSVAVVDSIGVGAGVVDILRHGGQRVVPFVASASGAKRKDATGTNSMYNARAAAWWHLRELLDPAMDAKLCLPPDDDLMADLSTPRFETVAGGKIKIESKDDIRTRLGRSTDIADALAMSYWVENYEREFADGRPSLKTPFPYAESGGEWRFNQRQVVRADAHGIARPMRIQAPAGGRLFRPTTRY